MATDTAIVTIEGEYETAPKLSNGTSFNDLERPPSQILRSRYYPTSNNSKMVQDGAIITMADHMTLNDPIPRFQGQAIDAEYLRNC